MLLHSSRSEGCDERQDDGEPAHGAGVLPDGQALRQGAERTGARTGVERSSVIEMIVTGH